jgi:hypothetical protein
VWHRVFGTSETAVDPEAVLEHLHRHGFEVRGNFRGDEQGWFHVAIHFGGETAIEVDRFLASEEGIRAQLNTWAAWLEEQPDNPHQLRLMQHMISTKQLFALNASSADDDLAAQICLALCRYFARVTDGVYQIDGRGFFDNQDNLLVEEREEI